EDVPRRTIREEHGLRRASEDVRDVEQMVVVRVSGEDRPDARKRARRQVGVDDRRVRRDRAAAHLEPRRPREERSRQDRVATALEQEPGDAEIMNAEGWSR